MFDFLEKEHNFYLREYNKFLQKKISQNYLKLATEICYKSDMCQILKYPTFTKDSNKDFLIVTSIFNSPEIFFINQEENLISNLQAVGNVYLINWQESQKQVYLENYVIELLNVINFLQERNSKKINIIGHCLGGIVAMGAALNVSNRVSSLTLLTTPWDFSHFRNNIIGYKALALDLPISNYAFIPKIYIQMMFFMLFPEQFYNKIIKYFVLSNVETKEKYMQIENWLQSGHNISSAIYNEIIDDLIIKNNLYINKWFIKGVAIEPAKIIFPVCMVGAKKDQIAPLSSMSYLQQSIQHSKLIEVEGGHISYLVNNDKYFQKELLNWLS